MIADQVDLDKILSLASAKKSVDMPVSVIASSNLTISVAKDPAFGFYYQDDLDAFKSLGVKINAHR
jgi:cobyrinic acid a,c-diamide synthase